MAEPAPVAIANASPGADVTGHQPPRTGAEVLADADLWAAVKAEPRLVTAALALAAVARHAESARAQALWLTETYPSVPPDRLARVAHQAAAGRARIASVIGVPLGGAASMSVQVWAQTRMILEVAAIFGHDPATSERAAEVLTLLRIYPDHGTSLGAVAAVVDARDEAPALPGGAPRIVLSAGVRIARRLAKRLLPGSGPVFDGVANTANTSNLATRTIHFYRAAQE